MGTKHETEAETLTVDAAKEGLVMVKYVPCHTYPT